MSENHCGSCNMCCFLPGIKDPELEKKPNTWCANCKIGSGCQIYDSRPKVCRDFKCLWLISKEQDPVATPDNMRPDRAKVMFSPMEAEVIMQLTTHPRFPNAWKEQKVLNTIRHILEGDNPIEAIVISTDLDTKKILIERGLIPGSVSKRTIAATPPDEYGRQEIDTSIGA